MGKVSVILVDRVELCPMEVDDRLPIRDSGKGGARQIGVAAFCGISVLNKLTKRPTRAMIVLEVFILRIEI